MKRNPRILAAVLATVLFQNATAQNTAPYWSLAGNSNTTTTTKLGTTNGVSLRVYAGNKQRMLIGYASGNVAIGTTSLSHRLTVGGNGRFTTGLLVDNGGIQASNNTAVGVTGTSNAEYSAGVMGTATDATSVGVYGVSADGSGVFASSDRNIALSAYGGASGVYANATAGDGVYANGRRYGVWGNGGEVGVFGSSPTSFGVYGNTANPDSYAGYFDGDVFSSGNFVASDKNLKQEINPLRSAMDILKKLEPKAYSFKQEGNYKLMNLPAGKHYGLLAQDVENVLPGLIKTTTFNATKATANSKTNEAPAATKMSFKALNYTELIPIIIKGMQEQQAANDALRAEMAELRELVLKLTNEKKDAVTPAGAYLEQNSPNPVRGSTTIRYQVPEKSTSCRLTITNAKGQLVKTITLSGHPTGSVTINTAALAAGTYNYTLWADGRQEDTKHLVIVR